MEFTLAEYMQLVKGFPRNEEIVKWLNWIFKYYKIDNPLRVSAFLGRIGHECLSFNQFEELASGAAYERVRASQCLSFTTSSRTPTHGKP